MAQESRVRRVLDHVNPRAGKTSPLWIRQVAWVARELEPRASELQRTLKLGKPYEDPEIHLLGVHNRVFALGGDFLEIVSPLSVENNTAAKQLERRGGDGGYMFMLQTDDFGAHDTRLKSLGFKEVLNTTRAEIEEIHLHPKDTVKCIVSLSRPRPNAEDWVWGGPDWQHVVKSSKALAKGIKSVTVQTSHLKPALLQYEKLLDTSPEAVSSSAFRFRLAHNQAVYVVQAVDGRGDGLAALELFSVDADHAGRSYNICGMLVTLA